MAFNFGQARKKPPNQGHRWLDFLCLLRYNQSMEDNTIEKVMDIMSQPAGLTESDKKRIERLNKYVARVEKAMEVLQAQAERGEFESFSEEDVRFHLSHDPNMIAEAGILLAKIHRANEYAKHDTKVILAELWNECNKRRDELGLTNAKDREAWVTTQPKYFQAKRQEIEWGHNEDLMKVILERYENLFVGSRKIASLIEKDNQNNYRIEKYD